ncbi:MAG: hydroxyacid dehydrogenase, partial [Evtepia sp.]|nr:hydroxyacid dehydrogenase [Evtepia sp.]
PPLPPETPLLHAKNAVLTPHVAFATEESMLRRAEIVFHNIDAFLAGRPENVCL